MIKLRRVLHPYLKSLHNSIYFQKAPSTAKFPYAVYDIMSVVDDGEGTQTVNLEIDGWTDEDDTEPLENLMSDINALNKNVISTDELSVVFYLETKIAFVEDDTKYSRRRYSYIGKLFEGS